MIVIWLVETPLKLYDFMRDSCFTLFFSLKH